MCWYPDNENSDVDAGDDNNSAPFHHANRTTMFCNQSNPVDYNLHQKLDLEDPEKEDEKEHWDTGKSISRSQKLAMAGILTLVQWCRSKTTTR